MRCCTARFLPVARRVAGDYAAAQDALQKSWAAVLHGIQRYRGGSPACAWVGTIVRHEAIHEAKRHRYVPLDTERCGDSLPQPTTQVRVVASPEDEVYRLEIVRLLMETIEQLSPMDREIIRLRDLQERPPEEVAARLRISRTSVSSRLYRAHAVLARRLRRRVRMHWARRLKEHGPRYPS